MDFDNIVVKESPGLCRCCLSEGCYKDLSTEYTWMDDTEIYADMLLDCFDISISQHNDGPNGPNRLICEVCVTRLRDACNFKKQVLASEKKFVDMIGRGGFKPKVTYNVPIKSETILEVQPLETEVEYLDEGMDFGDDVLKDDVTAQTSTENFTITTLPIKGKKGKAKKTVTKTEKKACSKVVLVEKPKVSKPVTKGENEEIEAVSKSSMTSTKRHRLMKKNAIIILESSTVMPFKWHRQNYLCFYCHQNFKDTTLLKKHTNEHKEPRIKSAVSYLRRDEKVKIDVSTIICNLCDLNFVDLNTLIEHLKTTHKKNFANSDYGVIPYKLHNDRFQCALCTTDFQYFIKLNQHMNVHYENYVCESCGKSFLSQDRLRCHSICHGLGFRCKFCTEIFDSLTQKITHEFKVHDRRKLIKCMYCADTFQNYTTRKKHHNEVHNKDMSINNCPICNKSFHIKSKMQVHIKEVHLREKNFSCTMCEQKFFSKSHVQKHMIKHIGERIHQCETCKKSYARKQTLRDHMRIHNNDRRFVCAFCSQAFVQNNSLRLHLRVHHPEVNT
ncbi:PREDICTED: gastrula zinc finger protein XlCGF26.1-like isoform X8 [Papilio polytes]|uniref:gastrula zinc finger protein XlCGF26.1-like isoform X8 n=1 Tax=Papilio polytes TaxID=76194 RepID=UPI000676A477|nr:PREDICTED: gastrula zinc finger protein XlCGF26.1-like isoform X8 [Papilio polytes]